MYLHAKETAGGWTGYIIHLLTNNPTGHAAYVKTDKLARLFTSHGTVLNSVCGVITQHYLERRLTSGVDLSLHRAKLFGPLLGSIQ